MEGSGQPPERGLGRPVAPHAASAGIRAAHDRAHASARARWPSARWPPPAGPPPGYTIPHMNWPAGARMTIPGNAEWALWFFVEILFAIIWASSDSVDASEFVIA